MDAHLVFVVVGCWINDLAHILFMVWIFDCFTIVFTVDTFAAHCRTENGIITTTTTASTTTTITTSKTTTTTTHNEYI